MNYQRILNTCFQAGFVFWSVSCTVTATATATVSPTGSQPISSLTTLPTVTVRSLTATLSPTVTLTPVDTLEPEKVTETLQPLLKEPMNCAVPCFWGIIPGKTHLDEVRNFFSRLGFTPFEGKDFYTILYKSGGSADSAVTFYISNDLVENIVVKPDIAKQKEGGPRKWIAYSPETLIKRYGKPSRVEFWIERGPNFVIEMTMYFDSSDLIVDYSGYNMIPNRPHSLRLCPLTAPFDFVRLWMGANPPDRPLEGVSLEKTTSLTIDRFTQLMLGDPQHACFTLNGDAFQ